MTVLASTPNTHTRMTQTAQSGQPATRRRRGVHALVTVLALAAATAALDAEGGPRKRMTAIEAAQQIIEGVAPLEHPRNDRLPFIVWRLQNIKAESDAELEEVLRALKDRGDQLELRASRCRAP
jgi:hypothetical protein